MANINTIDASNPLLSSNRRRGLAGLARSARSLAGHGYRSFQRFRHRRAVFSDPGSIRLYQDLLSGQIEPKAEAVSLRVRAIGDREVLCRPGTSDVYALWDCFLQGHHLPPRQAGLVRTILDLGANVGYAMVHFASAYPLARVLGIELDGGNARLCRRNIEPFGDRCEVLHGAAWTEDGQIAYGGESEWGFRVLPETEAEAESGSFRDHVRAYSLPTLLDRLGPRVDYVKMDVEGAEFDLLADCRGWIDRVGWMKVEVHRPRTTSEIITLLQDQGVRAFLDPSYADCVVIEGPAGSDQPTNR